MKKTLLFLGILFPLFSTIAQAPSNDNCSDRIVIPVTVAAPFTIVAVDLSLATEDDPALTTACESNASIEYFDVWYEFTMPVSGNIVITDISNTEQITIYDMCNGIELHCDNGNSIINGLIAGTTYVLRYSERELFANTSDFSIQAFGIVANDNCSNRQTITVATENTNTYAVDFREASEDDPALTTTCESNASIEYFDVWYEFTMPVSGNIAITGAANTENFTLYDACGGTELSCDTDDSIINGLTGGATYVLRYSERELFANASSFNIQAFGIVTNDNCSNRQTITVATENTNTYAVDFREASEDNPILTTACESNASIEYLDVWYEFTMPISGNVAITGAANTESFTLYDMCEGTELSCDTDDSVINGLTGGTIYVLRYSERELFANASSFNIQAFGVVANDDCSNRQTITVATENTNTYVVDFREASEDDPILTTACESNASIEYFDVWYEFTMPVSGNVVITGAANTESFTLYDTCGGEELYCDTDDSIIYNLTAGSSYVLRYSERELFANVSNFTIQAFETAPNDECEDATTINLSILNSVPISIDLRSASNDTEISCENNVNRIYPDVWYNMTMPVDGEIQVNNVSNSMYIAFFDACDGTELTCFFNDGSLFNVAAGTNVKMRASVSDTALSEYTFDVIVIPAPLATCTGTTEFINGVWNNGSPDNTMNVIIRDNYNTSTTMDPVSMMPFGDLEACSISIDTGKTLTIAANDFIEVTNNILVNGTLNIEHTASVLQLDPTAITTNNGTININVSTPILSPRDFMLMGSPMTNEISSSVFAAAHQVREHNTSLFIPNTDVAAEFPLAENFADDNGDDWIHFDDLLNSGEGYFVQPQPNLQTGGSFDLIFNDGTLNNGDITVPVTFNTDKNSSPNVLANPYPSAILADDFINTNTTVDEVYFWEHITEPSGDFPGYNTANFSMEDISMYNLMGGIKAASDLSLDDTKPNGIISTAQGFAIKANAAGTATFSNSMRRLTGNTTLRAAEEVNKLWLSITSQEFNRTSSTLIGFTNQATQGLDASYDSYRLANILSIFSGIKESNVELGIQSREAFNENISIPLGFSSQIDASTEYKISLADITGSQLLDADIFLLDTNTGTVINLSQTDYIFESEKGQFPNRFVLYFKDRVLNITSEIATAFTIAPNPGNGLFKINAQDQSIEKVKVYDYLGRSITSKNDLNISETSINISNNASGFYFIEVTTNYGALTKKYLKK